MILVTILFILAFLSVIIAVYSVKNTIKLYKGHIINTQYLEDNDVSKIIIKESLINIILAIFTSFVTVNISIFLIVDFIIELIKLC